MNKTALLYPLSNIQKGILQSELLYPNLLTNNICTSLIYNENINYKYFIKALKFIILNNEILRVRIIHFKRKYFQYPESHPQFPVKFFDLTNCNDNEIRENFKNFAQTKINVFAPCLYEFGVAKLSEEKTCLYIKFHHIISDSWSQFLFEKLLYNCYHIFINKKKPNFPQQSLADYLKKETEYMQSSCFNTDKKYFLNTCRNKNQLFPDIIGKSMKAQRIKYVLSKKETLLIYEFCKKNNTSPFVLVLSCLAIWFLKTENADTFNILTPVHNRNTQAQKISFGLFVNTLPFIMKTNQNICFAQHLRNLKQDFLLFLKHSKYPNTLVFEKMYLNNSMPSLFFSYENTSVTERNIDIEHFYAGEDTIPLSIHLSDRNQSGKLLFEIDYRTSIFNSDYIQTLYDSLKLILKQVLDDNSVHLKNINLVSKDFSSKMIKGIHFQNAQFNYRISFIDLFRKQVNKNPDNIAVVSENKKLSYKKLDKLSEHLASVMQKKSNSSKQIIVAVCMPKSEQLIVLFIAILKIGGVFFPVDSDLPEARKQLMIDIIKPDILISNTPCTTDFSGSRLIYKELLKTNKETNIISEKKAENIAVYFTSGTSGIPNAVYLSQNALLNLFFTWKEFYNLSTDNSNVLQIANTGFDVFASDIAKSLLNGGKLILCSKAEKLNMQKLKNIIKNENVCLFESTPAFVMPFMKYLFKHLSQIKSLKHVILGGDACRTRDLYELVNMFDKKINFYNSYGVTEAGIETSLYKAKAKDGYNAAIAPLGFAISDRRLYILNNYLELVPKGIKGYIYIGGIGVAQSYINNKYLSLKRFIKNPYIKGEILYRTGDIGRLLNDGNIEFLGREDQQVNLRGFRIEPAEIENKIKDINGVKQAVVVFVNKIKNPYLHAFIVKKQNLQLHDIHIQTHLKKIFPDYMIPAQVSFINKIPLTENAKIDYKKLQNTIVSTPDEIVAKPSNETEKWLHKTWCSILNIRNINIHKNIFAYGADSISVMMFVAALEKKGFHIEPQHIYNNPDIYNLSRFIYKSDKTKHLLLNKNQHQKEFEIDYNTSRTVNGVLLTGATGFLGIHLLKDLVESSIKVICPVREKNGIAARERLKQTWYYYHQSKLPSAVRVISYHDNEPSSLTEAVDDYTAKFTDIIHAAALVRQWGEYKEFEQSNVLLTKEITNYCMKYNKHLHLISTISVADFDNKHKETNNPYIQTKHISENIFNAALANGMKGNIYRTGNLTGRYSDGLFQKNIEENFTYLILKAVVILSKLPEKFINHTFEMTPVDFCSKAIIDLLPCLNNGAVYVISHKTETNKQAFFEALKEKGYNIKTVTNEEFKKHLNNISDKSDSAYNLPVHFLKHYFNEDRSAIQNFKTNFNTKSPWLKLNKEYFLKIIEDCENKKFFT